VWTVFKAAMGLKGIERVGTYTRFAATEVARKQFRKVLRTGLRKAIQDRVIKLAGPRIGRYLAEKYVMRVIPVLNAGIGYAFNGRVTTSVGRWAKVKAKVRASAFKQVARISAEDPDAKVWVLPLIFYVGTADGTFTENVLTLYSQTTKRLVLSEEQEILVEQLIDDEQLPSIFADRLGACSDGARNGLQDIAVTTAAVSLNPSQSQRECLQHVAAWLNVEYRASCLDEKVRYLQR
jgi:hypothetical protein